MGTRRGSRRTRKTAKPSGATRKRAGTAAKPGKKAAPRKSLKVPVRSTIKTRADNAAIARFNLQRTDTSEWISDEECVICARAAVTEWCGHSFYDFSETLRDLYAPKGNCGPAPLEELRQILGVKCHRTPSLSSIKCTMSFADLRQLLCGV